MEGFFELFAAVLVAVMFVQLGLVGTGHHGCFSGQGTLNRGLAACFSALEVVPPTLLTLDAWGWPWRW